jgi:hypothetical protein
MTWATILAEENSTMSIDFSGGWRPRPETPVPGHPIRWLVRRVLARSSVAVIVALAVAALVSMLPVDLVTIY